jgi:pimeloyl-ACP methyl ester carboxylesterase
MPHSFRATGFASTFTRNGSLELAFKALATLLSGVLLALAPLPGGAFPQQPNSAQQARADEALANSLPGTFASKSAIVNGVKLHYVVGGEGAPLFLLPGWPQTWWEFHKVMPELSKHYRVIAVDLRGMGGSDKPRSGYEKKNMAKDIHELARALGYDKINIAGHDIGAMVAYSYAANYPKAVDRIALIDVAHPDKDWLDLPLLPNGQEVGGTGEATRPVYLWWFAFNQVDELPGKLLAGRSRLLIDWLFDTQLRDLSSITERDRSIYAAAYSSAEAIRAGNAWYQTFGQDIQDGLDYPPVDAPLLGLIGERNYPYLSTYLPRKGKNVTVLKVDRSSHYVPEEQPAEVVQRLQEFFR